MFSLWHLEICMNRLLLSNADGFWNSAAIGFDISVVINGKRVYVYSTFKDFIMRRRSNV